MLTDEQYQEIENYLYSPGGYFATKYLNPKFFEDEWDDAVRDAAETADVTPGYPAKITLDPDNSEPPVDPEFNGTDVKYEQVVTAFFAKWIDAIKQDERIPDIIKNNIDDPMVQDLLKEGFRDDINLYDEDSFYDAVFERALNVMELDDSDLDW